MGNKRRVRLAFLAAIIFALFHSAYSEGQQKEIKIAIIPEMNVFKQEERFNALAEYLSKKTGVKVTLILSQYRDIIDRFNSDKLDGAFFGSFTGALAIQKVDVEPIARPMNLDGSTQYWGYLFVRKDSGIKGVKDMMGKKMAFVDKATSAGYIFPVAYLKQNGVTDLSKFFSEYYFTGSHDAAIYAVFKKEADIGAAKNSIYERIKKADPRVDKELVIIAESVKLPENGLCVRKNLDKNIKKKLKEGLLNMDKDPEGKVPLKEFGAIKFVETTIADYNPVFDMLRKAGIDLEKYNYRNSRKSNDRTEFERLGGNK